MNEEFWSGVRLVVAGLIDATKKASYSLGFGAGGLGAALVIVSKLGIIGPAAILISMSAFFILARIGKALDEHYERRTTDSKLDYHLKLERKLKQEIEPGREHQPLIEDELRQFMHEAKDELRQFVHEAKKERRMYDYRLEQMRDDFLKRMKDECQQLVLEECENVRADLRQLFGDQLKEVKELVDQHGK